MTIYDEMRWYVHAHDRNGWFDVTTETTPMYQMIDKAQSENAKLRELCSELLRMAESNDPDFLHWPEIHAELRKLGVEIVRL